MELAETEHGTQEDVIPADPNVKNFSYAVVDGEVYFRENSVMRHLDLNEKAKERVTGMVELRRIVNELIEFQLEDFPDEMIAQKQARSLQFSIPASAKKSVESRTTPTCPQQ